MKDNDEDLVTERQLSRLADLGIDHHSQMTKEEAAQLINEATGKDVGEQHGQSTADGVIGLLALCCIAGGVWLGHLAGGGWLLLLGASLGLFVGGLLSSFFSA